jgi:predicted nucleotidyltransferase
MSGRRSSLADALFTSTQQRVLGLLFGQPDRSFFVTQIMALANSGRGAVQRELSRLSASGLVTVTRAGNQKHYQANRSSPLFEELCNIVLKTVGLEEPLRAAVDALPGNIRLAMIYGSVAKRTDTSSSDIDLLIVSDDLTLEETYTVLASVEKRLDRRINPSLYTSQEFADRQKSKNVFLMRVLEGPTIILKGSIDAA